MAVVTGTAICKERKKSAVPCETLTVEKYGIAGDIHNGWEDYRQVSLLPEEEIERIETEWGSSVLPGRFGENLRIKGLNHTMFKKGDILSFEHGVVLEIVKLGAGGPASDAFQGYKACSPMEPFFLFCRVMECGVISEQETVVVSVNR